MPLPMHQISVPIFVQALGGLTSVLEKGEVHCATHNIDEAVLLQMRMFPNMFHMALQAKTTLYHSGGAIAQLTGQDVADYFGADETSFAVLKKQTSEALEFIQGVNPEQFDGSESRKIELRAQTLTGETYLMRFAIPQVFFHLMSAYNILRSVGVEVGKQDFLGEIHN
jgi:hypothetical protein